MHKKARIIIFILFNLIWVTAAQAIQPFLYPACLTDDARLTSYYQPQDLLNILHRYTTIVIVPEPSTECSAQVALLNYQARDLSPMVISTALRAYQRAADLGYVKQHKLTIVDYSKPSDQPRLWVFNLDNNRAIFHTWVTHGTGSGERYARRFSNNDDSHASSLGVIVTGDTYTGTYGYSLNLYGVEKGVNDNIYKRRIVVHPADYVGSSVARQYNEVGKSFGCLAVNTKIAHELIDDIKGGSIIVNYYPDRSWLAHSPFLNQNTVN
ncbi:MAG: murein L,D-transpeptidase catalytic domain family protein [Gammaproteobacteria bacterium]|nr:murein L,D-transpeptidase catalytic domain family protein [Gammaproteobacteria bacterium]